MCGCFVWLHKSSMYTKLVMNLQLEPEHGVGLSFLKGLYNHLD